MTKRSFLGANGLLLDERQMTLLAHRGMDAAALTGGTRRHQRVQGEAHAVVVQPR